MPLFDSAPNYGCDVAALLEIDTPVSFARAVRSLLYEIKREMSGRPWNHERDAPTLAASIESAIRDMGYRAHIHDDVAKTLTAYVLLTVEVEGRPLR